MVKYSQVKLRRESFVAVLINKEKAKQM